MKRSSRFDKNDAHVDNWLISYADMITLLLCFFIIFVSVSEPKRDDFARITEGLANRFGAVDLSTPFNGAYHSLLGLIESEKLMEDVVIGKAERSIDMEMSSGRFFQPNSVEFDEKSVPILNEMVRALDQINFMEYRIQIEVHTSDVAPDSSFYSSNWELSAARAARLASFFAEKGIDPKRLQPVGYGSAHPSVPNRDLNDQPIPANQLRNERIMIKIERVL